MSDVSAEENLNKSFNPCEELVDYMQKKLQLEKKRKNLHMRGKDLPLEDQKLDFKLRRDKTRKILDGIIFPTMANLTYFLESIAEHPELQTVFEDDLKDLFGIGHNYEYDLKKNDPLLADNTIRKNQQELKYIQNLKTMGKNAKRGFMFNRLISAALSWNVEDKETGKKDTKNFRLILLRILQDIIYFKIQHLLLEDFTTDTASIVNDDIGRARAWVRFYASKVEDDEGIPPHRTFKFEPI